MTKTTEEPNTRSNSTQRPAFSVVYIAYNEVSAMSGANDRSTPCGRGGSGEGGDREVKDFECMGRIARIPLVKSTASAMSSFYSSVKQSHCMVQTMFENVEDGWIKGAETVSPVTSKIEETLERPLRVIDSAACAGLDFIEEKLPSVKLPPEQIYAKSKDYMNRRVLEPALHFTFELFENVRERVSQYANSAAAASTQDKETATDGDNCAENNNVEKDQK